MIQYAFLDAPLGAVLLDLDGTLVDTAPDLIDTLNRLLAEERRDPVDFDQYRPVISRGSRGLILTAFGIGIEHPDYLDLRRRYLDLYEAGMTERASLFPDMEEVLDRWQRDGVAWGIVTNKPWRFTEPLLRHLGLEQRAACVVTPDHVTSAKPAPEPVLLACRLLGTDPRHTLFIGDAHQDMAAGRAAGARTLLARYGYIHREQDTGDWPVDAQISRPGELLAYAYPNDEP